MQPSPLDQDAIALRAYQLWESAGRPGGRDQEFWLLAEAELAAEARQSPAPSAVVPPAPSATFAPAAAAHEVPPAIQETVQTPERRAPRRRLPRKA